MAQHRQSAVFGRRREPHTVIIARGDEIRHFTVRPWLAALAGSALAAVAIGYILATSYLVLRDDLIGATVARQARMQQAYEDRISALRSQVDRITSRQLLDQQLMEEKVGTLLARQAELAARQGRIGSIMENQPAAEPTAVGDIPVPVSRPVRVCQASSNFRRNRCNEATRRQARHVPFTHSVDARHPDPDHHPSVAGPALKAGHSRAK